MAVEKELYDWALGQEKAGASVNDIVNALPKSKVDPHTAEWAKNALASGYSPDDIFKQFKAAEVAQPKPGFLSGVMDRLKSVVTPSPAPPPVIPPVASHVPAQPGTSAVDIIQRMKGQAPPIPADNLVSAPTAEMNREAEAGRFLPAIAEGAAATATGIPAFMVGSIGALTHLAVPESDKQWFSKTPFTDAVKVGEEAMKNLTYAPRTPEGQFVASIPAAPFRAIDKGINAVTPDSWSPEAKAAVKLGTWAIFLFAPKAAKEAIGPLKQWYYGLTVKERGLIPLTYADLRTRGYSDAQLARMNPEFFQKALAERMATKQPAPAVATETAPTIRARETGAPAEPIPMQAPEAQPGEAISPSAPLDIAAVTKGVTEHRMPENSSLRQYVDSMKQRAVAGDEAARRELMDTGIWSSPEVGIMNKAGWDALPRKKYQAYLDMDDLTMINGIMGHPAGDVALQKFRNGLRDLEQHGIRVAHKSGDEHLAEADDYDILKEKLDAMRASLANEKFTADKSAGDTIELTKGGPRISLNKDQTIVKNGVGVSYGIGRDEATADADLFRDKSERTSNNLRGPGGFRRNFSSIPRGERPGALRGPERESGGQIRQPDLTLSQVGVGEPRAEVAPPAPAPTIEAKRPADYRLSDYINTLSLPEDFAARQPILNRAYGEHRRDVVAASEAGGVPVGLQDYPDLKKFSPLERQYLSNAADAVRSIEHDNHLMENEQGDMVRSDRSWSTREEMAPWLPNAGMTHAEAASVLDNAAKGIMPKANAKAQLSMINEALNWYKRQAENAKFQEEINASEKAPEPAIEAPNTILGWKTPVDIGMGQLAELQSQGLPKGEFIALDKPFKSDIHNAENARQVSVNVSGKKIYNPDGVKGFPKTESLHDAMIDEINKSEPSDYRQAMTDYLRKAGYDGYVRGIDGESNNRELILFGERVDVSDPEKKSALDIIQEKKGNASQKEPWQMTRDEWFNGKDALRGNGAYSLLRGGNAHQSRAENIEKFNYGLKPKFDKELQDYRQVDHRDVIKKALSEGKPVPPEVLKEYPDLNLPESFKQGSADLAKLFSFPGPVGKFLRRMLGINDAGQAKWVERAFDFLGDQISPAWKEQVGKVARVPAFYVEEHPEAEPLYDRNVKRSEENHRDARFIFDADETGYKGVAPIMRMGKKDFVKWDEILTRGDIEKVRYTGDLLKQRFKASDAVVEGYEAMRDMIERLQALIIEKRKEIALSPYETDKQLHGKLLRVMNDLIEIPTPEARETYIKRLTREQASVLDHETKVALNRVAKHVEGIHEDISRFEENPGYIPRTREEGAYHVRAIEHVISQDEAKKVLGAIMYGWKARAEYSPAELLSKFGIKGKAVQVYKDTIEELKNNPAIPRRTMDEEGFRKEAGKAIDRLANVEVFMKAASTKGKAKRLRNKVTNRPAEYFKENYRTGAEYEYPEPMQNKKLPEEIYQDIGNPAAREAIIERAVSRAQAKGSISVSDAEAITDEILGAMSEEQLKRGAGRSFLQRSKNLIEGYETKKLDKVLASHITGMVGYLNKALYSVRALRDMDGIKDPYVLRWANKYYKDSLKNSNELDRIIGTLRGAVVFYRLGFVTKTMVQNSTQQAQTAYPEMSRYTPDAAKLLSTAEKDYLTGTNLTELDNRVVQEGIESGQADAQYMRNIMGATDTAPGRGWRNVVEASMKGFGIVETEMNRKPALIAAMRLFTGAKNMKGEYYGVGHDGQPYDMTYEEALPEAKKFVEHTHYEISRANEPEVVRGMGPIGRGIYTFGSYSANNLNWLFNRARHGYVGVLGRYILITWALGGILAAPFADEIDAWLEKHFGLSIKLKIRQALREQLGMGRQVEDLIMNGIPAVAFGVDLSKSVQVNTPLPIQVLIGTDDNLTEKASGAIGGLAVSGARAVGSASKGDWWRAGEYAAPNAVGNILRGVRLYREGATTSRGRVITDEHGKQLQLTGGEAIKKGLGFQPARMSRYREATETKYNLRDYWKNERQNLLDRYRISKGDQKKRAAVMKDVQEFNKRLMEDPQGRLLVSPITAGSLIRAIMNKPGMQQFKEQKFTEGVVGQ